MTTLRWANLNTPFTVKTTRDVLKARADFHVRGWLEKIWSSQAGLPNKDNGQGFTGQIVDGIYSPTAIGLKQIQGIVGSSLQGEVKFYNDQGAVTWFQIKDLKSG